MLFVVLRGRSIWLLPVLLLGLFAAASVSASEELVDRSQAARAAYVARPDAHWVDHGTRGPVTLLYDGLSDWRIVWTQLYWNGRIRHVLDLPAVHVPGPLPQLQLQIIRDDGLLRLLDGEPPDAPYVVASQGFHFRGRALGRARRLGLFLWQVDPPLRLRTWAQGVQPNGDVLQGGVATLDVFDCGRGRFHVVAIGRDDETLELSEGGTVVAQTKLWPQGVWEYSLDTPARAAGNRCTFTLSTTSVVHLATFEWTAR